MATEGFVHSLPPARAESRRPLYSQSLQSFEMSRFNGGSLPQLSHPNASRFSASRVGGSRRCTMYGRQLGSRRTLTRKPLLLGTAFPCHGVTCASVKRNTTSPGAGSHREDSGAGAPARVSMHATTLHSRMHVISSADGGTVAGAGSHRIEY
jgi:hypothetical protein